MKKKRQQLRDIVYLVWKSALAFVGVLYFTGFLILFTFFNRMGIEWSGAELLRFRYIHVGVLYLAFPIFVLLPFATLVWWTLVQPGRMDNEQEALTFSRRLAARSFIELVRLPGRAVQRLMGNRSVSLKNEKIHFRDYMFAQVKAALQNMSNWPAVFLVLSLGITFYCFAIFATRQYMYMHQPGLVWMLAGSLLLQMPRIFLLKKSTRLAKRKRPRVWSLWLVMVFRWFLGWFAAAWALGCAVVLLCDINEGDLHNRLIRWVLGWFVHLLNDQVAGEPIHEPLFAAIKSGYIYLIFLYIAAVLLLALAVSRAKNASSGKRIPVYAYAPFAAIIMSLFFLATWAFAHELFAFIPVSNGGGDYSHSPDAQICMKPPYREQFVLPKDLICPPPVPNEGLTSLPPKFVKCPATMPTHAECSVAVKVIDSTEQTIFVARSDDYGHKEDGTTLDKATEDTNRKNGTPAAKVWREGEYLPKVYALNRAEVVSIEYGKDLAGKWIH